jgi:hypothetical protein
MESTRPKQGAVLYPNPNPNVAMESTWPKQGAVLYTASELNEES